MLIFFLVLAIRVSFSNREVDNGLTRQLPITIYSLIRRAGLLNMPVRAYNDRLKFPLGPGCDDDPGKEEQASKPEPVDKRIDVNLKGRACSGGGFPVHKQNVEIILHC